MEWAPSHVCCLLNTSQHTAKHMHVEADSRVMLHLATTPAFSMRSILNKPRSHSKNIFTVAGLSPGPDVIADLSLGRLRARVGRRQAPHPPAQFVQRPSACEVNSYVP